MNELVIIAPLERVSTDLVYAERATRERSLCVLMQDVSSRPDGERRSFLSAAYRGVVTRYQSAVEIERALPFLRRTVRELDALSIQVDTRVDDLRGLGIFVLLEEASAFYLLCPRDAPPRVRCNGAYVPLTTWNASALEEIAIETTRSQQDLFAQTLPDNLAVYRVFRSAHEPLEFLIGGLPTDVAAALDALETRVGSETTVTSDRVVRSMLCARFDAGRTAEAMDAPERRAAGGRSWVRGAVAASLIVAMAVGVGFVASRVDFERPAVTAEKSAPEQGAQATQSRPTPVMTRETSVEERVPDGAAIEETPRRAPSEKFALAWEQTYSEPVTSSPSVLGDDIVFGSRDGHVYAIDRASGEKEWSHAASGGVGASPLVRDDAVFVADYGGNVYRLTRAEGRTIWKRALKEKIVSTPASTRERMAVGTSRGNVYALSTETGRVLWKFATRGQIRGGIAHAAATFFVPSHDGKLYALADDTGRKRWSVTTGGPVASTPDTDGERVVIGNAQGHVVAYAISDGKRLWSFATRAAVNSAILVQEGRVYAGSGDDRVYCLDARTGELQWSFETSGSVLSRPFVTGNRVVVTSYDGSVYALDAANGELLDRYATDKSIFSSPVVHGDRVFFGNNGGRFYCLTLGGS